MDHTGYELVWLFFCYSFIGWILETVTAAVRQKKFLNRGLVNAPLCILYGAAAVTITVFGRELRGFWLFAGAVVITTLFEWIAGHLIEKIYHERWWDYSEIKGNLDGYICPQISIVWGILSMLVMYWGNNLLLRCFGAFPEVLRKVICVGLILLLLVDILATVIVISGKTHDIGRWETVDKWLTRCTLRFGDKIYLLVNKRLSKAYPKAVKVHKDKEVSDRFAYGCSFYKIVWLFVVGSFLGDIVETVFCRITAGVWMSRSSLVWGAFSVVWGLAVAFATLLLYRYRNQTDSMLFTIGLVLGGAYEYICSVFTEIVFGVVFWDYSSMPFNLGGRINLLYCFFWGIAAVIWMKKLFPPISAWIEKVPVKAGKVITWFLIVFMCCNMAVSGIALIRRHQREEKIPAEQTWQQLMDEWYGDEKLEKIYPNVKSVT